MITDIPKGGMGPHGWRLAEFENEIDLGFGEYAELQSDYGLVRVSIETSNISLLMRSVDEKREILLYWPGMRSVAFTPTAPIIPDVMDGLAGILGIRLMEVADGLLTFVIDGDWFDLVIVSEEFSWQTWTVN